MDNWNNREVKDWSSCVAHWVKDSVLSLQWLRSLLWCGFDPWPGNVHVLWEWQEKKKKEKGKRKLKLAKVYTRVGIGFTPNIALSHLLLS